MAARKTIKVSLIKEWANELLTESTISDETKSGICTTLEEILHETDNYKGFNYVYWLKEGCDKWVADGRDQHQQHKYLHSKGLGEHSRIYY
jgi:hypothetical protein